MTYVVLTVVRLVACLRLAWWFYPPMASSRPSPLLRAIGIYFYVVAVQRGWWLVRSGFSSTFTVDGFVISGIAVETIVLLVMCWKCWKRSI